jgi:phosphatidylinositol alpha-mannosyltransferase
MRDRGHHVSVLAPASADAHAHLPDFVVSGGKAVPIPYNGSVARLRFGPATLRKVKKWLLKGDFDVLHLHEPNAPSLSMLALQAAEGPIVATFHLDHEVVDAQRFPGNPAAVPREDRRPHRRLRPGAALADGSPGVGCGGDPQRCRRGGVRVRANAAGYPRAGRSVLFLGRYDEPRKGMSVLLGALPALVATSRISRC